MFDKTRNQNRGAKVLIALSGACKTSTTLSEPEQSVPTRSWLLPSVLRNMDASLSAGAARQGSKDLHNVVLQGRFHSELWRAFHFEVIDVRVAVIRN